MKPHRNTKHSLAPACHACCRDMKTGVRMKPTPVFISPYHGFEKRPKSVNTFNLPSLLAADPDFEPRRGAGSILLAQPACLPLVSHFFFFHPK